jgi:hypothetical protein
VTAAMVQLTADRIGRRSLLVGAGATIAGLALAGRGFTAPLSPETRPTADFDELSITSFLPHVGSTFTVRTIVHGTVSLELLEAVATLPHPSEPRLIRGEAFDLLFSGPLQTPVPADIQQLSHSALELPTLFLSPVGRSARFQDYQAIVDRRIFESGPIPKKGD